MTEADHRAAWREQKSLNAAHQADELRRRQARESDQARELLRGFVAAAQAAGLPQVPLVARSYNGTGKYKTALTGWYLKSNQTLAVDSEARFYVLAVHGSFLARFTGATVHPSDPPLVLGAGGRDGESIDLVEAIDRILHPEKY